MEILGSEAKDLPNPESALSLQLDEQPVPQGGGTVAQLVDSVFFQDPSRSRPGQFEGFRVEWVGAGILTNPKALSAPEVEKGLELGVSEASSARGGTFRQAVEKMEDLVGGQRAEFPVAEFLQKRESG